MSIAITPGSRTPGEPAIALPDFDACRVSPAIRTAMRLLELEQVDPPAIEELAARVGLSPVHFSRTFATAFGQTSSAYGRRIRLDRLAKDWETSIASSTTWALIASIRMLTRRTARNFRIRL